MTKAERSPVPAKPEHAEATPPAVTPRQHVTPALWTDPLAYMRHFNEEMNRLFHNFGLGRGLTFPTLSLEPPRGFEEMARSVWSPQVELFEREGTLFIRADLPGLTRSDITVEIDHDVLTITGERKTEVEEKKDKYFRSERSYGSFYRSFRLPERADSTHAAATFKDGVLEVTIPVPPKPEPSVRKLVVKEPAK